MIMHARDDDSIEFKELHCPLHFITETGEELTVVMVDSGFELLYNGVRYTAKKNKPLRPMGVMDLTKYMNDVLDVLDNGNTDN